MNERLLAMTDVELAGLLSLRVYSFDDLTEEARKNLLRIARGLLRRGLPLPVVWAGVESAARITQEMNPEGPGRFKATGSRSHKKGNWQSSRINGARRVDRDKLLKSMVALLREARAARGRHEIKKLRQILLRIDQSYLRRSLGKPAEDLCQQINDQLRRWANLF